MPDYGDNDMPANHYNLTGVAISIFIHSGDKDICLPDDYTAHIKAISTDLNTDIPNLITSLVGATIVGYNGKVCLHVAVITKEMAGWQVIVNDVYKSKA